VLPICVVTQYGAAWRIAPLRSPAVKIDLGRDPVRWLNVGLE
jgi:hypothetical protein